MDDSSLGNPLRLAFWILLVKRGETTRAGRPDSRKERKLKKNYQEEKNPQLRSLVSGSRQPFARDKREERHDDLFNRPIHRMGPVKI